LASYNGKSIFECEPSDGNECRRDYVNSIEKFINKKFSEANNTRDEFTCDIVENQEAYRKMYLDMIGQPVYPYPNDIPSAKTEYLGKDDFGDIYRLQIEVMPDFQFFGILMRPHGIKKAPLVIAQHGGGGFPELCSDFSGKNNYSFFTKRALQRGMTVFAPQLMLWEFLSENKYNRPSVDVPYNRAGIDEKLRHIGLSITGLEVFCLRRSVDFLHSLEYIDESRTGMMGLSYGGYFSLHTAAADKRIKSIYAAAFFNDRTKIAFKDWQYYNSANTFCDAEVAALCAPRRLQIDVGRSDHVFDFAPSVAEAERSAKYYEAFGASENFRFNLWEGGHSFDESGEGFDFFFDGI